MKELNNIEAHLTSKDSKGVVLVFIGPEVRSSSQLGRAQKIPQRRLDRL
jgi:hypothetical protein